jgi:hypothetical protein
VTTLKLGANKQNKAKAGAGATGIEPETAIQRDCSVTNTPKSFLRGYYNNRDFLYRSGVGRATKTAY